MIDHDPFALFDDLKDYPGKRPPVNRKAKETSGPPDEDPWDAKPAIYVFNGHSKEFFTIGHLSKALNRSPVTLRSWEKKGLLPRSPYRSPAPKTSFINGPPKGRRLWTRDQIEGLLQIAEEEGCIVDANRTAPSEQFTQRVAQLFKTLREQEQSHA